MATTMQIRAEEKRRRRKYIIRQIEWECVGGSQLLQPPSERGLGVEGGWGRGSFTSEHSSRADSPRPTTSLALETKKKSILFFFTNCTKSFPPVFGPLRKFFSSSGGRKNAAGVFARAARSVLASSRLEKKVLPPTKSQRRRSRGLPGILLLALVLSPFA